MHPHDMNRIMHCQLISNAEAINAHDLVDELHGASAGDGGGETGRHALVPLRSSANASSFFGSEGLTAKEIQDGLGVKKILTYDCDEPDYQYGTYGYTDGKENMGYFFSADVELGNPTSPHTKPYPLSMIYAGFEGGVHHQVHGEGPIKSEDDHAVAQMGEMPGPMNRADLELSDSTSEYTESSTSSLSSSSTLEVSSPSSEDSLFEVPVTKRACRRRRITPHRQPRKFFRYESNGTDSPIEPSSPPSKEPKIIAREPRFEGDLYTPRFQRGTGEVKEGFCGLCTPGVWLRIKQSSYWYHMNYHHGISAATGRPYEGPTDFQVERISRTEDDSEKGEDHNDVAVLRISGTCGTCGQSVTISNKYLEGEQKNYQGCLDDLIDLSTVNLMAWYKHAQRCHRPTKAKQY